MRTPNELKTWMSVMGSTVGTIEGHLTQEGLARGEEYEITKQGEDYLMPRWCIHVFDMDPAYEHQLVIVFTPLAATIEYGLARKDSSGKKETVYKRKIDGLRYKISEGTSLEYTPKSEEKVHGMLAEIREILKELIKHKRVDVAKYQRPEGKTEKGE